MGDKTRTRASGGRRPKVISLFSGVGGLDYGFEAAGFDTAVAVEFDHDSCSSLRESRPNWHVVERDIFLVPSNELLEATSAAPGEVDAVIGGPPCQPFSKAGYWASGDARRLADPRANTLAAYLRVVEETLPKMFLLENVHGLTFSGKDEGLRFFLDNLALINRKTGSNYRAEVSVLNAAAYGVPQLRERVFIVASREGRRFEFPSATHTDPQSGSVSDLLAPRLEPYRTAWDALGDIRPSKDEDLVVRGKWAHLLPSIPEGQNYLWHTERGGGKALFGWRRRFWSFLLKLAKDRPSWTLQAQPGPAVGPFHWENRRLSWPEMARLQTFPDNVAVVGRRASAQKQIGNAVPSLLAETLANEMAHQFLGRPRQARLSLLPPVRQPVPAAEPPTAVPDEYLNLVGKHSAHPGTGRGYAAERRLTLT